MSPAKRSEAAEKYTHRPVLLEAVVQALDPSAGGMFIDCTLGLGGHSEALLAASHKVSVLGIDRDEAALAQAQQRLAGFGPRFQALQANFKALAEITTQLGIATGAVQGVLADLGVSSLQLDSGERGFSFQRPGPLDMRMDCRQTVTAALLVNTLSETELADLIYQYGEEPASRAIARRIVQVRVREPIETTTELADIVAQVVRRRGQHGRERIHPATRTFQALRIAVNEELNGLDSFVHDAVTALVSGGRLAIITFHSLEDRIIKNAFRFEAGQCRCPPGLPLCICGTQARVWIVTKKPIIPAAQEVAENARARSAKLRVCERL
ncbi:MAG: 16S rRNA (cytosine(1402)-N(4))-methyltransferase RsmH [Acidobacteriota bacterium]